MPRTAASIAVALAALLLAACGTSARPAPRLPAAPTHTAAAAPRPARPRHVVVVVMENHSYSEIIGNPAARYLNRLARHGLLLTHMHAVAHPSQPNYLALFSGSPHGIRDDSCPHRLHGPNLGSQLRAAGYSFVGWAEGLPHPGSRTCSAGEYARKHAPWVNFADLPRRRTNRPFSQFPRDYRRLPTVSFVVPNLRHDMHDGTVGQGDRWVRRHLAGYARWSRTHGSLLVVTWDEADSSRRNHVPTIITGAGVGHGRAARQLTHYSLLRLLEGLYRLPRLGHARTAPAIPLR